MKPKYGEKAKLCYMDTDSFIFYIKTEEIYSDIAKDIETRFDNSNNGLIKPLLKGKNKKVIGLMKDELGRKIMKEFASLRTKTYSHLTNNNNKDKHKSTKTCVVKGELIFEDFKHSLEATQVENKINHLEKNNVNLDNL